MPVRVVIHSSLVSKNLAKSSLVTLRAGSALPVPIIFISIRLKLKTRFLSIKNDAKVPYRTIAGEKSAESRQNVAKFGNLG